VLTLILSLTLGATLDTRADPSKNDPPKKKELFAGEEWYKNQEGKEQEFVGVLKKADRGGRVGFGRFNPYRLEMKGGVREVYIGGKPDILKEFVGRSVQITGKPVDLGVEGRLHKEIWPARIELKPAAQR
jgi:hypothetical protein